MSQLPRGNQRRQCASLLQAKSLAILQRCAPRGRSAEPPPRRARPQRPRKWIQPLPLTQGPYEDRTDGHMTLPITQCEAHILRLALVLDPFRSPRRRRFPDAPHFGQDQAHRQFPQATDICERLLLGGLFGDLIDRYWPVPAAGAYTGPEEGAAHVVTNASTPARVTTGAESSVSLGKYIQMRKDHASVSP